MRRWDLLVASAFAWLRVQNFHGPHFWRFRSLVAKGTCTMLKILLVEDNAADVYLIRAALKEHEIECTFRVAADGDQVMRFIDQQESQLRADAELDLIILDLNVPRHDGLEILTRLREVERFTRVPVVVLTSSDSPKDRITASELGVAHFLRKPSSLEQFLSLGAVFKDILGRTQAHSGEA